MSVFGANHKSQLADRRLAPEDSCSVSSVVAVEGNRLAPRMLIFQRGMQTSERGSEAKHAELEAEKGNICCCCAGLVHRAARSVGSVACLEEIEQHLHLLMLVDLLMPVDLLMLVDLLLLVDLLTHPMVNLSAAEGKRTG